MRGVGIADGMVVQVTGLQLQYELSLYISYFHTIASVLGRPAPTALPQFRCRVPTLIEQCYLLYMYFTIQIDDHEKKKEDLCTVNVEASNFSTLRAPCQSLTSTRARCLSKPPFPQKTASHKQNECENSAVVGLVVM